jgi:hypothetical protein
MDKVITRAEACELIGINRQKLCRIINNHPGLNFPQTCGFITSAKNVNELIYDRQQVMEWIAKHPKESLPSRNDKTKQKAAVKKKANSVALTQISMANALALISVQKPKFKAVGKSIKFSIGGDTDEDDFEDVDLTQTKLCRGCNEVKTLDLFYKNKCMFDGRNTQCKACQSAREKAKYAANPEAQKLRIKLNREKNQEAYKAYQLNRYYANKLKQGAVQ